MIDPIWCVMPVLAGPEMTEAALSDLLAQSIPTRVLVINQGVDDAFRDHLEALAEQDQRIFLWHHQPPLPSLSASWNLALDLVWQSGGTEALVVNNDVRLHPRTIETLLRIMAETDAYFVSCVGVTAEQFDPTATVELIADTPRGGPDFSCFLISRACHQKYRFDEGFIPAFCEDLDYHRRLLLSGNGAKIFSVNLPYLHLASQTLKTLPPEDAARIRRSIDLHSRAHYAKKWGGPVNAETFFSPFSQGVEGISTAGMPNPPTTPALQAWQQGQPQSPADDRGDVASEKGAEEWAHSNQQEDERGQVIRGSEPERSANPDDAIPF